MALELVRAAPGIDVTLAVQTFETQSEAAAFLANVDAENFAERTLLTIRFPKHATKKIVTEKHLLQLWRDAKDGDTYKATQIFGTQ